MYQMPLWCQTAISVIYLINSILTKQIRCNPYICCLIGFFFNNLLWNNQILVRDILDKTDYMQSLNLGTFLSDAKLETLRKISWKFQFKPSTRWGGIFVKRLIHWRKLQSDTLLDTFKLNPSKSLGGIVLTKFGDWLTQFFSCSLTERG